MGPTLLMEDTQKKVLRVLAKLFSFHGSLVVQSEVSMESKPESAQMSYENIPESVLDEKQRLKKEEKEARFQALQNHPLAQKLCETFEGKITQTHVE